MSLCAVIPAAGRGSRLGADRPKILVEVADGLSIWNILSQNLSIVADDFNVIVSPDGRAMFDQAVQARPVAKPVAVSIQPTPRGMGDAVFCGAEVWRKADNILVVWGDQVHVSAATLKACVAAHTRSQSPQLTLPVVRLPQPYVEYVFSGDGVMTNILQAREGDVCSPNGWGDVGTFLLSTYQLEEAWRDYVASNPAGAVTGELNFLPFMVFLSQTKQWPVTRIVVDDINEARGINTQEDLAFFRKLYMHN